MSKKSLSITKKLLSLTMVAVCVGVVSAEKICALGSADVFYGIKRTDVPYSRGEREYDLYSDVYSLKQVDSKSEGDERELRTPETKTVVNATKIWSSDRMGTAIATQSPGCWGSKFGELFSRFANMIFEVNNPCVVVLGPVKDKMFCSTPGDIVDYFGKWGFGDAQAVDKRFKERILVEEEKRRISSVDEYRITHSASKDGSEGEFPLFHFSKWEDSKVPSSCEAKDALEKFIISFKDDNKSTLIVHCSAGIGRTGTFLACLYALKTGERNPVKIVKHLREYRTGMVQRVEQFDYVCKFILRNLCGLHDLSWDTKLGDEEFKLLGITAE